MNTKENNEKKPKTDRERGIAENERANYTGFPQEDSDDRDKKDDSDNRDNKDDIKETNNSDERDKAGGDIAGNAAGNTPAPDQ